MNLILHQRLVSKILHDIIAPASSVLNGIELLETSLSLDSDILGFMREGAVALNEKLKMFRLTFGATGDNGITNLATFTQKTTSYLKITDGRFAAITRHEMTLSPKETRILGGILVMVNHIATGPYTVVLGASQSSLTIEISGLRFHFKGAQVDILTGANVPDDDAIDVHLIQAWMVKSCADACGLKIDVTSNEAANIGITLHPA